MKGQREREVLIEVKNVHLEYEAKNSKVKALEDINFNINKGEFVCLLGPSGCGKTTLLNILAGFIKPTSGECLMRGLPILKPGPDRGVVFQSHTLYPWMNVRENIEFGLKMKGISLNSRNEISQQLIEKVKLCGFEEKPIFELSGGMKQRVALARVLANRPEVILMDEPFGALDALTRIDMQKLIRNIWYENGNTIFMITHDIDEALTLGTKILLMSDRPGKILKEYSIGYTMQLLEGEIEYTKFDNNYFKLKDEILSIINKGR